MGHAFTQHIPVGSPVLAQDLGYYDQGYYGHPASGTFMGYDGSRHPCP